MKTNTKLKKIKNYLKKFRRLMDKNIVISMGENCLCDDVLARYDIKSFSTPYSSGRSNVEYVLAFEKEKYADFLNSDYLVYEQVDGDSVARNKKYVETENHYHDMSACGMEFTHHDVIALTKVREQIAKRCRRLLKLSNKNLTLVYHNRYCDETDMQKLIRDLKELEKIYTSRKNHVQVVAFTQKIVSDEKERKVVCEDIDGVKLYTFYTLNIWQGTDQEIFWARCDDDLIKIMIDQIRAK